MNKTAAYILIGLVIVLAFAGDPLINYIRHASEPNNTNKTDGAWQQASSSSPATAPAFLASHLKQQKSAPLDKDIVDQVLDMELWGQPVWRLFIIAVGVLVLCEQIFKHVKTSKKADN